MFDLKKIQAGVPIVATLADEALILASGGKYTESTTKLQTINEVQSWRAKWFINLT